MLKKAVSFLLCWILLLSTLTVCAATNTAVCHLVPNADLSQCTVDSSGNKSIQLWFNFRESVGSATVKDVVFSAADIQRILSGITLNGITLADAVNAQNNVSVVTMDGTNGAQFYVKIIYEKSDGTVVQNALNISANAGYVHFAVPHPFVIVDRYSVTAIDSYFFIQQQVWKTESEFSFTSVTNAVLSKTADKLRVELRTDKSAEENRGDGNFQNISMRASKRFRDCIAINGLTLWENYRSIGEYGVNARCTQSGIMLDFDTDCKNADGQYTSKSGICGIVPDGNFVIEVREGLVLNGNPIKAASFSYDGKTGQFTPLQGAFTNPVVVCADAYNNDCNEGIISMQDGSNVIRLTLSEAISGAELSLQNKTNENTAEEYALSRKINSHLYIDGLNLEAWAGYRNSSLNTVSVNRCGSLIEIKTFAGWEPAINPAQVHWLELADGFEIATGIRVEPAKFFYDPQKGCWERVSSFENLQKPAILIKRETVDSGSCVTGINNADVMPQYRPNSQVTLENNGNGLYSPDWVKTLIIEEANVLYASENGTFSGMGKVIDHMEEMGVNGLWITPIFAPSQYLMYGPDTVSPVLTGKTDYDEGWRVVADFVEEAHRHNIRVFFDIVTWGVHKASPTVAQHPDWFKGIDQTYGGYNYNWENEELVNWFSNQLVQIIEKTNADGFRADCGVKYCGYEVYRKTRTALNNKGYKICMFSEDAVERKDVFDFEQDSSVEFYWRNFAGSLFTEKFNILDVVKKGLRMGSKEVADLGTGGQDRFYTSELSNHDSTNGYDVNGSIIKMGYSGILSPFIPLWYIGDEWNNPLVSADRNSWLFGNTIDWSALETNREYYEQVKQLIRIRRSYPEIFDYYPQNHRQTNICAVSTNHTGTVQAYARYADNKAVIVVPNKNDGNNNWRITVPFGSMGLDTSVSYTVTDLLSGEIVGTCRVGSQTSFTAEIMSEQLGVFALEAETGSDEPIDPSAKPTVFVVPHDTQTQIVGDGRVNLWFKLRNDQYLGSTVSVNLTDPAAVDVIKENLYINGIQLGAAMQVSSNIKLATFTDGQFYVQIRYANQDGTPSANPFYIPPNPDELAVEWHEADLSGSRVGMVKRFYDFEKRVWVEQISVCDTNLDGNIDVRDLVHLKKYVASMEKSTLYDINADGKTNALDLVAMKKTLLAGE